MSSFFIPKTDREIAAGTVLANPSGSTANPVGVDAAGMRTLLSSVGYVSQSLTDPEKSQARENIGVDGLNSVSLVLKSATSGGTWGPMDGSALMFLGDAAYLIGGWYGDIANADWTDGITTNLVYRSTNFGVTWVKIKNHDLTPDSTHFPPGHTMAHTVHTVGATEYLYLFHGDSDDNWGDVYRSADGITWAKVNSVATAYDGTILAAVGALDGDLYLVGGCTTLNTAEHKRVVYKSTDDGATWTSLGNAPWSARVCNDHLVSHMGKLWLIGGGIYDDTLGRAYYNDVWSFDGTTWTEVLANGHSQWSGRYYANVFELGGWLYISRGYNAANLSDTFRSRDGVTWFPVDVTLVASHADAFGAHPTGVLIGPGNGLLSNNVNTNSPTYFLRLDGNEDIATGVETMVRNFVPESSNEFDTIIVGSFIYSETSDQILVGEDPSGFYICGGNGNSAKPIILGSGTTSYVQLYGARTEVLGIMRLSNAASVAHADQDLFAFSSQPATRGTWHAKAFRPYNYQIGSFCEYGWDENNADAHLWNAYPGDATYGGWRWLSGVDKTLRAYLTGLGKLILDNTLVFKPEASTTLTVNGQMTFDRVSNTQVKLKLRGTDGVTRETTLTLS